MITVTAALSAAAFARRWYRGLAARPPARLAPAGREGSLVAGGRHGDRSLRLAPWLMIHAILASSFAPCAVRSLAAAPADRPIIVEASVTGVSSERGLIALSAGRAAGVALGDQFWVFRDGLYAAGQIQVLTDSGSTGFVEGAPDLPVRLPAAILRLSALSAQREALPPEVTVRGLLARVTPGRRSAWLDIGSHAGLMAGDTVLVRRPTQLNVEMPLARGRVEQVRPHTALIVLQPIVSNTLPQPGDIAELWPSPSDRRLGRVESMVLAVSEPDADGRRTLTLAGSAEDGLEIGRLVDLFHGREYVGHAIIDQIDDPNSTARTVEAGARQVPQVGDRAWMRSPPGPPPHPLTAAIFGIVQGPEGQMYAQIAAGDTDGLRAGEGFIVRHQDPADPTVRRDVAELTVSKVNDDHSTAVIRPVAGAGEQVMKWDLAERRHPPTPDWRAIGIVQQGVVPASRSAVVTLEPRSTATVGRIVRWIPEAPAAGRAARPPGAAIVIHRSAEEAILYVPPGWGGVDDLMNARLELADPPAAAR